MSTVEKRGALRPARGVVEQRPAKLMIASLLVLFCGCGGGSEPVTEIIVVADSEIRTPGLIDEVGLIASPVTPNGTVDFGALDYRAAALDGSISFPFTHSVRSESNESAGMLVSLFAIRNGIPVAEAATFVPFRENESRGVTIHLPDSCLGVSCYEGVENDAYPACVAGQCVSVDYGTDPSRPWDEVRVPIELCDGVDNDFDSLVDEGIDTQRSSSSCGGCGAPPCPGLCAAGTCDISAITAVSAGSTHVCALHQSGAVSCWGNGRTGATSRITGGGVGKPIHVPLPEPAQQIAAGSEFTCAVLSSGGVMCWGKNDSGALGSGGFDDSHVPVAVIGVSGVVQVAAGQGFACALTGTSEVYCWGDARGGQLGRVVATASDPNAGRVMGLPAASISKIAAGEAHACALVVDDVYCWGTNYQGQVGDDENEIVPMASPVPLVKAIDVAAGVAHTCVTNSTGEWVCWGEIGQAAGPTPVTLQGVSGVVEVTSAGFDFSDVACARTLDGQVFCLGDNTFDRLQVGRDQFIVMQPTRIEGLGIATRVDPGGEHICAIRDNGDVLCWGNNGDGQLGNWAVSPNGEIGDDVYSEPVVVLQP